MGSLFPSNWVTLCFMCYSLITLIWFWLFLYGSHMCDQSVAKYPFNFADHSLLDINPYASNISTTIISMNWKTLSSTDNRINKSFIPLITLTVFLSNWMILHEDGVGWPLIVLHNEIGMTLDEAPKYTKQLCTLWLKISKDNKKGKV